MKTGFQITDHLRILIIMCMILNCCGPDERDDIGIDVDRENIIAFTSDRDGNNEIYLMNSDGTEQT